MSQDERHPFDAERFLDGFTVEESEVQVDPASPLGKAMAEHRGRPRSDESFDITGKRGEPVTD